MDVQVIPVERISIVTEKSFWSVVAAIDAQIGHPDMAAFRTGLSSSRDLRGMEQVVTPATQPNGLMEFMRLDLGEVIRKENGSDKPKIIRLIVGNPLIMKEMVKHVPDAGSYAPVTVFIEERGGSVRVCYDRMASYLAPYGNEKALEVARGLDAKIERILGEAVQ
jgi:uncharacterized protein (DUF302 family)